MFRILLPNKKKNVQKAITTAESLRDAFTRVLDKVLPIISYPLWWVTCGGTQSSPAQETEGGADRVPDTGVLVILIGIAGRQCLEVWSMAKIMDCDM